MACVGKQEIWFYSCSGLRLRKRIWCWEKPAVASRDPAPSENLKKTMGGSALLRIAGLPILGSSRETEPTERVCVVAAGGGVYTYTYVTKRDIEKEMYFKELANAIVRADKSKVFRTGCQTGNSGRAQCYRFEFKLHQFSSVTQSCLTLCDPMDCSIPGLSVHQKLPEFTQTHVHRVSDAIQVSHPLSSPSPPALNLSQHRGLFK